MPRQAMLATVHILINVNGADKNAEDQSADVLRELLTDNGLSRDKILDWSFLPSPDDDDLCYPQPVQIPDDYDRDEADLPYIGARTLQSYHSMRSAMTCCRPQHASLWDRAKEMAKRAHRVVGTCR